MLGGVWQLKFRWSDQEGPYKEDDFLQQATHIPWENWHTESWSNFPEVWHLVIMVQEAEHKHPDSIML